MKNKKEKIEDITHFVHPRDFENSFCEIHHPDFNTFLLKNVTCKDCILRYEATTSFSRDKENAKYLMDKYIEPQPLAMVVELGDMDKNFQLGHFMSAIDQVYKHFSQDNRNKHTNSDFYETLVTYAATIGDLPE